MCWSKFSVELDHSIQLKSDDLCLAYMSQAKESSNQQITLLNCDLLHKRKKKAYSRTQLSPW